MRHRPQPRRQAQPPVSRQRRPAPAICLPEQLTDLEPDRAGLTAGQLSRHHPLAGCGTQPHR